MKAKYHQPDAGGGAPAVGPGEGVAGAAVVGVEGVSADVDVEAPPQGRGSPLLWTRNTSYSSCSVKSDKNSL